MAEIQEMPRTLARTVRVDRAFYFDDCHDALAHAWEIEDADVGFTACITKIEDGTYRVAFIDGEGALAGFLSA